MATSSTLGHTILLILDERLGARNMPTDSPEPSFPVGKGPSRVGRDATAVTNDYGAVLRFSVSCGRQKEVSCSLRADCQGPVKRGLDCFETIMSINGVSGPRAGTHPAGVVHTALFALTARQVVMQLSMCRISLCFGFCYARRTEVHISVFNDDLSACVKCQDDGV
jgi:hypothetical protein